MLTRLLTATVAACSAMVPVALTYVPNNGLSAAEEQGVIARYYDVELDLSESWGAAQACVVSPNEAVCFDTERELDDYLGVAPRASCSTSVRLYAGTSYGLPVLAINTRLSWQNLSNSGFDNVTRSYKIGSCAATFAKNSNGGGGFYPGDTSAGAQSTTMQTGWDKQVSSVYLH